ncbi:hypothetical protein [Novosphingobium sp.]|uniref:hypothetical protein n=1 Tax=Novosphingobium sp. TaxID=1874826 RepID=UPI002734F729|nr:hypothetical protein [Novosphingobium sp.]MDP3907970.1 hypothetical protein [Novosphingobium sp.]
MTDNSEKSDKPGWTGKAALAGAAIGSAALAAALLYASRRRERADKPASKPIHEDLPETD